jgi:hypothetical protein
MGIVQRRKMPGIELRLFDEAQLFRVVIWLVNGRQNCLFVMDNGKLPQK